MKITSGYYKYTEKNIKVLLLIKYKNFLTKTTILYQK